MKKFTFLIVFFLAISITYAQEFWEEVPVPQFEAMIACINVDADNHIVLGTDTKIFYSDNDGDVWTESLNWPGHWPNAIKFNSSNVVFIATSSNGLYKSEDGGATFTEINNGLLFLNVWDILILENDDIIVATQGGLYKSTDDGGNWSSFGAGLPVIGIQRIAMADNGYLFAGTQSAGMYRSVDNGENWETVNNGLPENAQVTALIGTPNGELFAGIYPDGMFLSNDYGNQWEENNNGLPFKNTKMPPVRSYSVDALLFMVYFLFCIIYSYGMYFIYGGWDYDYTWAPLNGGLPDEPTTSCIAASPGGRLFLGTYDQGLYRNAIPVSIENNKISFNEIMVVNYPNPFNTKTQIKYYLPETSTVEMTVIDQNGQLIERLINKKTDQGSHTIDWAPQNLPSGVYYLNVKSGNNSMVRKMVHY